MRHKHADLIKAWLDGIECQYLYNITWYKVTRLEQFNAFETIRIKPEPKADIVEYYYADSFNRLHLMKIDNDPELKITFDGETGKIKSAEVIK